MGSVRLPIFYACKDKGQKSAKKERGALHAHRALFLRRFLQAQVVGRGSAIKHFTLDLS